MNKVLQKSVPHRTFHNLCSGHCKKILRKHKDEFISIKKLGTKQEGEKDYLSTVMYGTAAGIVMLGVCYASVPLYRIFCQVSVPYAKFYWKNVHVLLILTHDRYIVIIFYLYHC